MQEAATIEIFKTNIEEPYKQGLLKMLSDAFPHFTFNVDLGDCDRILRIKGDNICTKKIIEMLHANDFFCEHLS